MCRVDVVGRLLIPMASEQKCQFNGKMLYKWNKDVYCKHDTATCTCVQRLESNCTWSVLRIVDIHGAKTPKIKPP